MFPVEGTDTAGTKLPPFLLPASNVDVVPGAGQPSCDHKKQIAEMPAQHHQAADARPSDPQTTYERKINPSMLKAP